MTTAPPTSITETTSGRFTAFSAWLIACAIPPTAGSTIRMAKASAPWSKPGPKTFMMPTAAPPAAAAGSSIRIDTSRPVSMIARSKPDRSPEL